MVELLEFNVNESVIVVYVEGFGFEEFKFLEVDESILKELFYDGYMYFFIFFLKLVYF